MLLLLSIMLNSEQMQLKRYRGMFVKFITCSFFSFWDFGVFSFFCVARCSEGQIPFDPTWTLLIRAQIIIFHWKFKEVVYDVHRNNYTSSQFK